MLTKAKDQRIQRDDSQDYSRSEIQAVIKKLEKSGLVQDNQGVEGQEIF